jgi:hypothetical protein
MEITQVDVVIGLQYGDEGKGKITNQLAYSGNYDAVVRFNGGGNAGHNVALGGGDGRTDGGSGGFALHRTKDNCTHNYHDNHPNNYHHSSRNLGDTITPTL